MIFLARFEKAAQCGFRGVEFMFPYDYDIEELKQVLASNKPRAYAAQFTSR